MCRACDQGGRRCPSDAPDRRRARQNAAYHAKKHTTDPREPESGHDDAASSAGLEPLSGPVTAQMVRERVEHARAVLERADDHPSPVMEGAYRPGERLTQTNEDGWLVPTEYGLEAEAATRAAGAAIAARAEELAESRMEEALRADKELLKQNPDGLTKRAYAEHVGDRAVELKRAIEEMRRDAATRSDFSEQMDLYRRSNEMIPEANMLLTENARIQQGDGAWDRAEAKVYSDAYREVLAEQRSMGLPDGKMIEVDPGSQKATTKRLEKGLAYYPSDWLARDGSHETSWETTGGIMGPQQHKEHLPLRVTSTSKRAHYAPVVEESSFLSNGGVDRRRFSELTIDKRDEGCLGPGVSTAMHEYGHRAERIQPRVNDLAQAHLARRTATSDGSQRHGLEPYLVTKRDARAGPPQNMWQYENLTGKNSEWVRSDDFAERYTGKQNSSRDDSSEVFSTGMEGVFAGRFGGLRGAGRWKEDREHRDFILGTLASVR